MQRILTHLGRALALSLAFATASPVLAMPMPAPVVSAGVPDVTQVQQTQRERRFERRQDRLERRFERRQERRFERRGTRVYLNGLRGYSTRHAGWRYYNGYYFPPAAFTIIIR